MRFLLASTGLGALSTMIAAPAVAETVISTATTSPVQTSVTGNLRISSAGSIKLTTGNAVTINTSDVVKNEGAISVTGSNGSSGILANANLAGDILNSGTITVDEDFTPTDTDKDGDVDGPFAQGNNRFGIHVLAGGTHAGNVINTGTITVEGNQSAGIAIDSTLAASLTSTGKINILGNDSVGIRASAVTGNVTIGGTTNAQGQNSVGVLLGGDIGGALVIQGAVNSTGYRSATPPADTSKLDADDLLQGGSAVVVQGNVNGGILLDTGAAIASFGAAPGVVIGSATQDINLGAVASSSAGHGLVIKGTVTGQGVYSGVSATGLSIGGAGHAVNIAGGVTVAGTVSAVSADSNATAIRIGTGVTVPEMVVSGTISAKGAGTSGTSAQAIVIDSGATVNSISNSGSIIAARNGTSGSAAAIVDHSGTVGLVQNNGQIGVADASALGDAATAIDLRANAGGAIIRQIAAASGAAAPLIAGNVLFGAGNDTLDLQAGTLAGKVDFGGGADVLSLTGTSLFRGVLANSAGVAATIGTGATLDAKNLGVVDLASLTAGSGALLGVTIAETGHTLYNVAGTASFGTGSKILVTLDHVGTAAGTYTIIDAGTLTGAENLTSSVVTLPFLFKSALTSDTNTGQVSLKVELKGDGELGLNRSEAAILGAAIAAADADNGIRAVFLTAANGAAIKSTLQQLLPEHAGGAFEAATKGSRLATQIIADPQPIKGLWAQQVTWGSSKSVGDTSSYDLTGWGGSVGYDHPLGSFGSVGITGAYLYGHDGKDNNELTSDHYEASVYWRGGVGGLRGWVRGTIGTVDFKSTRNFNATVNGATVERAADGKWSGSLYSGAAGVSYEARLGRFSFRPNASIEYYKLTEKGYTETGGGEAFDLTVRKRSSDETAANAMFALGYDFVKRDPENGWLRLELEGGRREILSGSLGSTTASFGDGDPFTLDPEQRTSGWRGGLRVLAGDSSLSFVAEVSAEEQQSKTSLGGRAGLSFTF
jgi:hypothetical protein